MDRMTAKSDKPQGPRQQMIIRWRAARGYVDRFGLAWAAVIGHSLEDCPCAVGCWLLLAADGLGSRRSVGHLDISWKQYNRCHGD